MRSELSQIVEVVCAVESHILSEAWRFYQFLTRKDKKVCPQCSQYDLSIMSRTEIENTFPYLEKVNQMFWLPHVHPNCRCVLMFEEEEDEKSE